MISFWIKKCHKNRLKLTALWVAVSFLFTAISAPFAQARLFKEFRLETPVAKNLDTFAKNLEHLRIEDGPAQENIAALVDALRNRLSFVVPVKKDEKTYLLGAYQGNQSRVNFILQIEPLDNKEYTSSKDPSYKEVLDMLRSMPGSSIGMNEQGSMRSFIKALPKLFAGIGLRVNSIYADDEARKFVVEESPFEVSESEVTEKSVLNVWGKYFGIKPSIGDGRLHFERTQLSILSPHSTLSPFRGRGIKGEGEPDSGWSLSAVAGRNDELTPSLSTVGLLNDKARNAFAVSLKGFFGYVILTLCILVPFIGVLLPESQMHAELFKTFDFSKLGWGLPLVPILGSLGHKPEPVVFDGFNFPTNLAILKDGKVLVVDSKDGSLKVLNPGTGFVKDLMTTFNPKRTDGNGHSDKMETGEGTMNEPVANNRVLFFSEPWGVSIGEEGMIWVTDSGDHSLIMLDTERKEYLRYGKKGNGEGEFFGPRGVAIDGEGKVYVADTGNNRFQILDPMKNRLITIDKAGELGEFKLPYGIAIDKKRGIVYVADTHNHRVLAYNIKKKKWSQIGGPGTGLGEFQYPTNVAVDPKGGIAVIDIGNKRIQFSDRSSKPEWSSMPISINAAYGIAYSEFGHLLVADSGSDKVHLFPKFEEIEKIINPLARVDRLAARIREIAPHTAKGRVAKKALLSKINTIKLKLKRSLSKKGEVKVLDLGSLMRKIAHITFSNEDLNKFGVAGGNIYFNRNSRSYQFEKIKFNWDRKYIGDSDLLFEDKQMRNTDKILTDAQGNLYLFDLESHKVYVLNSKGKLDYVIACKEEPELFNVDRNRIGRIVLYFEGENSSCDNILELRDGEFFYDFKFNPGENEIYNDIAFDSDGNLLVDVSSKESGAPMYMQRWRISEHSIPQLIEKIPYPKNVLNRGENGYRILSIGVDPFGNIFLLLAAPDSSQKTHYLTILYPQGYLIGEADFESEVFTFDTEGYLYSKNSDETLQIYDISNIFEQRRKRLQKKDETFQALDSEIADLEKEVEEFENSARSIDKRIKAAPEEEPAVKLLDSKTDSALQNIEKNAGVNVLEQAFVLFRQLGGFDNHEYSKDGDWEIFRLVWGKSFPIITYEYKLNKVRDMWKINRFEMTGGGPSTPFMLAYEPGKLKINEIEIPIFFDPLRRINFFESGKFREIALDEEIRDEINSEIEKLGERKQYHIYYPVCTNVGMYITFTESGNSVQNNILGSFILLLFGLTSVWASLWMGGDSGIAASGFVIPPLATVGLLHRNVRRFIIGTVKEAIRLIYDASLMVPGISSILTLLAGHKKFRWFGLVKEDQESALSALESLLGRDQKVEVTNGGLPRLPFGSLVSFHSLPAESGSLMAVHPGLLASSAGVGATPFEMNLAGSYLNLELGIRFGLSDLIARGNASVMELGQLAFHPYRAVQGAGQFLRNSVLSAAGFPETGFKKESSGIRQIEEALGSGTVLDEDIYTVLSENSHQQNFRLILNQPELEKNIGLVKEFAAGIERETDEERVAQLVIVTDPGQMDKNAVKRFLKDNKLSAKFVDSKSLRIVHERMKEDLTYSFRNLLRKNPWLKEGDYSNWLLNRTKRWSDLVGQILSDFFTKNGIELLELDLRKSFVVKTAA